MRPWKTKPIPVCLTVGLFFSHSCAQPSIPNGGVQADPKKRISGLQIERQTTSSSNSTETNANQQSDQSTATVNTPQAALVEELSANLMTHLRRDSVPEHHARVVVDQVKTSLQTDASLSLSAQSDAVAPNRTLSLTGSSSEAWEVDILAGLVREGTLSLAHQRLRNLLPGQKKTIHRAVLETAYMTAESLPDALNSNQTIQLNRRVVESSAQSLLVLMEDRTHNGPRTMAGFIEQLGTSAVSTSLSLIGAQERPNQVIEAGVEALVATLSRNIDQTQANASQGSGPADIPELNLIETGIAASVRAVGGTDLNAQADGTIGGLIQASVAALASSSIYSVLSDALKADVTSAALSAAVSELQNAGIPKQDLGDSAAGISATALQRFRSVVNSQESFADLSVDLVQVVVIELSEAIAEQDQLDASLSSVLDASLNELHTPESGAEPTDQSVLDEIIRETQAIAVQTNPTRASANPFAYVFVPRTSNASTQIANGADGNAAGVDGTTGSQTQAGAVASPTGQSDNPGGGVAANSGSAPQPPSRATPPAQVRAELSLANAEEEIIIPAVFAGQQRTVRVRLENSSAKPITSIEVSTSAQELSIGDIEACLSGLAAGSRCSFEISFDSTAAMALRENLTVAFADEFGTLSVDFAVSAQALDFSLSSTSVDFPNQTIGETATQTVTVGNLSDVAQNLSFSGLSSALSISEQDCATLAASGSCSFTVSYTPTDKETLSQTLTIHHAELSASKTISIAGSSAFNNVPTVSDATVNTGLLMNTEGLITLAYQDDDGDLATSCSLSSFNQLSETAACSCDSSGLCQVGLTGSSDYFGQASFTFTVTDKDGVSTPATIGLTIYQTSLPPQLTTADLSLSPGARATIRNADLRATDDSDQANELVYTVQSVPSQGDLLKDGKVLTTGSTFTQAELAFGYIAYAHTAGNDTDDSFTVSLSDSDGNAAPTAPADAPANISITVNDLCSSHSTATEWDEVGSGPYVICTPAQIEDLASQCGPVGTACSAQLRLSANLDMTGITLASIGSSAHPFAGSFDGGFHQISKMTFTTSASDQGLFGIVGAQGRIENLRLVDSTFTVEHDRFGSLVGNNAGSISYVHLEDVNLTTHSTQQVVDVGSVIGQHQGTATHLSVEADLTVYDVERLGGIIGLMTGSSASLSYARTVGTISGTSDSTSVAGLVGKAASDSSLSYAHTHMSITAGSNVGGAIGTCEGCQLQNTQATGSIQATDKAGILVGTLDSGTANIRNNLGLASLISSTDGGLIGETLSSSSGTIAYNLHVGTISSGTSGFAGSNQGTLSFISNLWDSSVSGQSADAGGSDVSGIDAQTTENLYSSSTYVGWNFTSIWTQPSTGIYPSLSNIPWPSRPRASCNAHLTAGFTADGVYQIDPDGLGAGAAPYDAYCDMTTDNGGWTLVMNYLHKDATTPSLSTLTDRLPLQNSTTLGTDESSQSTYWGHASTTLLADFSFSEARFYCKTSEHERIMHFKTTNSQVLDALTSNSGSYSGVQSDFTALSGHTAFLPAQSASFFTTSAAQSMNNFPFYRSGSYHWATAGFGNRWECDDYSNQFGDSLHQVWIR